MQSAELYTRILKELTILYVEDDLDTQNIIAELLESFCSNVLVASDGKEALEIYNTQKIDLMITDIEMPKMDGIDLIKEVRNNDRGISIIVMSAYSTNDYLLSIINLKIESYIIKPISFSKIKEALFDVAKTISLNKNIHTKISKELYYDKLNASLIYKDSLIELQKKEKMFMDLLIENKGSLVSYELIEKKIWNDLNEVMSSSALRTIVKRLRHKVDNEFIKNISGIGYKLI